MVLNYTRLKNIPLASIDIIGTITVDSLTDFPEKSATSGVEKIGVISKVADPILSLETTKGTL